MTDIGPVQLLAVGFGPEADYQGGILDQLECLDGKGMIRVLDLLFVARDEETGQLVALDYQGDVLGELLGALLDFAFEDGPVRRRDTVTYEPGAAAWRMTRNHLESLVRSAPPGEAIALVLIEHVWATGLKKAIRTAKGTPLAEAFLAEDALDAITAELTTTIEILEELEREEAVAVARARVFEGSA